MLRNHDEMKTIIFPRQRLFVTLVFMTGSDNATAASILPYFPQQCRPPSRPIWTPFVLFAGLLIFPYLLYYPVYRTIWFLSDGPTYAARYNAYRDLVTSVPFTLTMLAIMSAVNLVLLLPFLYFTRTPARTRLALRKPHISVVALGVFLIGSFAVDVLCGYGMYVTKAHSMSLTRFYELFEKAATQAPVSTLLVIAVLGPIAEEILFRGFLQTLAYVRRLTPFWGILLTSILFGIFHRDLVQGLVAVFLGLYLGAISYHAGSILPSMLCHMAINGFSTILAFAHEGEVLISPPVVAASSVILIAALFLLTKTVPPGAYYRKRASEVPLHAP